MALRDQSRRTIILAEQALALALFISGMALWEGTMPLNMDFFKEAVIYWAIFWGGLGSVCSIIPNWNPYWGETLEGAFLDEISTYIDYGREFMATHKGERIYYSNAEFMYWLKQAKIFISKTLVFSTPAFPAEKSSEALEGFFRNLEILHAIKKGVKYGWILLEPNLTIQEIRHYRFRDYLLLDPETKKAAKEYQRLMNPKSKKLNYI